MWLLRRIAREKRRILSDGENVKISSWLVQKPVCGIDLERVERK